MALPKLEDLDDEVPADLPELPPVPFPYDSDDDEMLLRDGDALPEEANFASMPPEDVDLTPDQALDTVLRHLIPHTAFGAKVSLRGEPNSFAQAMKTPQAEQWYKAAEVEIRALLESGTWELVKLLNIALIAHICCFHLSLFTLIVFP